MILYIARDKDKSLYLYDNKPTKGVDIWKECTGFLTELNSDLFPEVKWEDEKPTEVELLITKKL